MSDDSPSTPDSELRALARQLLQRGDVHLPSLPEEDVSRLVQELQVAYAELQVQYRQIQETQRRLASSEARYRALFEEAPTGVLVVDRRGQVIRVNRTLAGWLQRRPADLIGRPFVGVLVGTSQSAFAAFVQARVTRGSSDDSRRDGVDVVEEIEIVCRALDGTQFPASLRGAAIPGEADTDDLQVLLTCTDLRPRRLLEERLRRAQKLEALGILAGGIAHDFNNTLQIMRGYAEFLVADELDDATRKTMAAHVLEAAERARQITAQIQLFARRRMIQPEVIDIGRSVGDTLHLLRPLLGDDVVVDFQVDGGPLLVRMDGGQLGQVVMNLAANARDAMDRGGALRVTARQVDIDALTAEAQPGLRPGRHAELRFADDGCGIAPEHVSRIFDPFFTTKPVGRGSGLGLATVYDIVQRAGGAIEVLSEPGAGTEFVIRLPFCVAADDAAAGEARSGPAAIDGAAAAVPARGSLTILLVDDSTPVRDVAASMLDSAGHRVHVATGPDEALDLVDHIGGRLDLLVTDVVMPRMNGFELAERIRDRVPDLPTLFVSGHTRDEIAARGSGEAAPRVLAKPFSREALLHAVATAVVGRSVT